MERVDMEASVKEILPGVDDLIKLKDGTYERKIYASYDDRIGKKQIEEIMEADDPELAFTESVEEMYLDWADEEFDSVVQDVIDAVEAKYGGLTDEEIDDVRDYARDIVSVKFPYDHYRDQDVCLDMILDIGDGNYDYTLNYTYPAVDGSEELDQLASLRLLAELQGYTLKQLRDVLKDGDIAEPKGFLESVRQEVANESGSINMLTILVRMTLGEAMKLAEKIHKAEATGHQYSPWLRPDCGSVTINKDATVGLYDAWNGGGSLFDIELEKDIRIPIRYISSCLPDGCRGRWSVESIWGMMGSAWKECVISINETEDAA